MRSCALVTVLSWVPPSSATATVQVSWVIVATAASGPSGWARSSVVGRPRLPVGGAGSSLSSRAATSRLTVSAANPLGMPSSCATAARVTPGRSCTARNKVACAVVRGATCITSLLPRPEARLLPGIPFAQHPGEPAPSGDYGPPGAPPTTDDHADALN